MGMDGETQRTLITASSTLIGTLGGGSLLSWVASRRERSKEAREARSSLHTTRRESLRATATALHQASLAFDRWKMNRSMGLLLEQNREQEAKNIAAVLSKGKSGESLYETTLKHFQDSMVKSQEKSAKVQDEGFAALAEQSRFARDAMTAAAEYGDLPGALGTGVPLVDQVHDLFAGIESLDDEAQSKRRSRILAVAKDLGTLASWEGRCAASVKAQEDLPELPKLNALAGKQIATSSSQHTDIEARQPDSAATRATA